MKTKTRRTLQKALIAFFAIVFAFLLLATEIAYENKSMVTGFFGVEDFIQYEIIEEEGEEKNTEYFESQYNNIREVVYGGYQIQLEEQVEGTVLLKNDNNALPLTKGSKVSLFGNAANSTFFGASGSGGINTSNSISWEQAFNGQYYGPEDPKAKLDGDDYFVINPDLFANYNKKATGASRKTMLVH